MAHGFLLAAAVLVGTIAASFYFLFDENRTYESHSNGSYSSGRGGYSSNPHPSATFDSGYDTIPVTAKRRKKKEDKTCAICMESMETCLAIVLKVLPCTHMFHLDCISTWGREKKECPVCRRVF